MSLQLSLFLSQESFLLGKTEGEGEGKKNREKLEPRKGDTKIKAKREKVQR